MEIDTVPCCYLDVLPPEVLLRILSSLSTYEKLFVRQTCRRLYSLSSDSSLWTHVTWHYSLRNSAGLFCALKLARLSLKRVEVHVSGRTFKMSDFCIHVARCKSLGAVYLDLGEANIRDSSVKKFLLSLQPNSRLSLYASQATLDKLFPVSRSGARSYAVSDFVNVQDLEIPLVIDFREWIMHGCQPPYVNCVSHKVLHISKVLYNVVESEALSRCVENARLFITSGVEYFRSPKLECSVKNGLTVPVVILDRSRFIYLALSRNNIGDEKFSNAVRLLDQLYPFYFDITDAIVLASISSVQIEHCLELQSKHLAILAQECPGLAYVNLTGCWWCLRELDGLAALASSCVRLTDLSLKNIHRHEVSSVTKLWEILSQISRLKSLALTNCLVKPDIDGGAPAAASASAGRRSTIPSTSQQSFEKFQQCTEKMTLLRSLELVEDDDDNRCNSKCGACFTDAEFRLLSKLTGIKCLYIELPALSFCSGLAEFLSHLKYLTVLSVQKHPGNMLTLPTEPAVYQRLEELTIDCNDHIVRDEFVSALIPNPNLVYVDFKVHSIHERAVVELAKSCPKLVNFKIASTHQTFKAQKKAELCLKSLGIGTARHTLHRPGSHW